jgi:hypothetical protein
VEGTVNPNSLKNLKPFKPGQSGNPAGRPKTRPITERYAILAEIPLEEATRKKLNLPEGATYADAVVFAIYRRGMKGDIGAGREIREAIEGKSEKSLAHTLMADNAMGMLDPFYTLGSLGSTVKKRKP